MPQWTVWTLALLAMGGSTLPAAAHPHVWIDMESDVVTDDSGFVKAINVQWTFDDGYAQAALEGLDTNKDGEYSQTELAPLTKENMDTLKDYEFFTFAHADGKKLPIGDVSEYGQIFENGKLTLYFVVPLKTPVDPRKHDFYYQIYDPEFFIEMDFVEKDPVSVVGALPPGCKLDVRPIPNGNDTEQTKSYLATKGKDWKPPPDEDFGAMFAQPVHIACAG